MNFIVKVIIKLIFDHIKKKINKLNYNIFRIIKNIIISNFINIQEIDQ